MCAVSSGCTRTRRLRHRREAKESRERLAGQAARRPRRLRTGSKAACTDGALRCRLAEFSRAPESVVTAATEVRPCAQPLPRGRPLIPAPRHCLSARSDPVPREVATFRSGRAEKAHGRSRREQTDPWDSWGGCGGTAIQGTALRNGVITRFWISEGERAKGNALTS